MGRGLRPHPRTYHALRAWLAWRFGDKPEAPPEPPRTEEDDAAAQRAVEHRREDEHAN